MKKLSCVALVLTGVFIVGCNETKSTAPFAPTCSADFLDAYDQLDLDSKRFQELLEEYNSGRGHQTRQELREASNDLLDSCVYVQEQGLGPSCLSDTTGSTATKISISNFDSVCDSAEDYADYSRKNEWSKREWETKGRRSEDDGKAPWEKRSERRDQFEKRPEKREELPQSSLEVKSLNKDQITMLIKDGAQIQAAFKTRNDQALAFVNGELLPTSEAIQEMKSQGVTTCALKTTQKTLTAQKKLALSEVNSVVEGSIEKIRLKNEQGLSIICQKDASQPTTLRDVDQALGGIIDFYY